MPRILVANTKGGCGKSTLATNLAACLAALGHKVVLLDSDRQQSARLWLSRRPDHVVKVFDADLLSSAAVQKADWLVEDSPGAGKEKKISDAVADADLVLVPMSPSAFDVGASGEFLAMLAEEKAVRKHKTFVGLVGMRVNARSRSSERLLAFMDDSGFPVLTMLRASQVYVTAAEEGLSIFELRQSAQAVDMAQWQPLMDWVLQLRN